MPLSDHARSDQQEGGAAVGAARAMLALSTVGATNMSIIALRQLGVITHLPDPPLRGFDADRVTASRAAYLFGIPDAPVEAVSLFANIPLVLLARGSLGRRYPGLVVLLGAKCTAEAVIGAWYFEHMRRRVGAWCAYCIVAATVNATLAALALPSARRALPRARPAATAAVVALVGGAMLLWMTAHGRGAPGGARTP